MCVYVCYCYFECVSMSVIVIVNVCLYLFIDTVVADGGGLLLFAVS